ncbi:2,2-dialkylglycine decarboxylase (pyruvate) [Stella humosa]|uniref:2,2-dialkylglycine decarboxylase (Pyruvate) n=1 Tax=Stella humosa TaxID=94 RepID=A0A3N1MB33_9PROT|nr:aspartate aminotransferase family protein [Stella humosa]ROQ00265.1 2,2-dialkylglycine decarboxylase (pyruvate) [Stella humosa]BBK30497.1 aspartate aminotransferase family protein [Stella humosa]
MTDAVPFGPWSGDVADHLIRYTRGGFLPGMITRAEGSFVHDADGRAILDFASGQMCATIGHNHPAVVQAMRDAAGEPLHLYSNMLSPAVVELAVELAGMLPPTLQKAMFLSTGSESNEAAIRIAKLHTGGFEIIAMGHSWHGMTAASNASTYSGARKGYGPAMPGTMALPPPNGYRCPIRHCAGTCDTTCLDVGFEMADMQSVGAFAAVICEPVLAAGGIVVPPEGYMRRLREHCDRRGLLLIFDEAQTAFGRLGSRFVFEQQDVVPDILTLSKSLGGGLPLAATITSAAIEADVHAKGFHFYTSHISDPFPARVALTILKLIEAERLVDKAKADGAYFMDGLRALQQRYETIGDVRGLGLLVGVELVEDRASKKPATALAPALVRRCYELGLQTTQSGAARDPASGAVWKLAPPLTVTRAELDQGLEIIDRALGELTGRA